MKISASSANTYQLCQRKYWHRKINSTPKDQDYEEPKAILIGKTCAEIHERIDINSKDITKELVLMSCARNGLSANDAVIVAKCVRKYIETFDSYEILDTEVWIENEWLSGRVDKIGFLDQKRWIIEDKTASEIPTTLKDTLKLDTQLCIYAACAEQFDAVGIIYRVVTKAKQRRKKLESWEDYYDRCTSEAQEYRFTFDELDIDECMNRLKVICGDIDAKKSKEDFTCSLKACDTYGKKCEFYSQCH